MRTLRNVSFFVGICALEAGLAPVSRAATLIAGDFNNDGFSDLARADIFQGICIALSNGNGSFQHEVCYPAGSGPIAVLTADVDGDGNLDLLGLNPERTRLPDGVAVLLGNGNGTFQPAPPLYPAGPHPQLFALGDLNGDGVVDIAVLGPQGLCSLLGQGDGTFLPVQCFSIRETENTHTLLTGDLTGQGRSAFIWVTSNSICVWSRNTREPRCTRTPRISSRLATAGSFTADGKFSLGLVGSTTAAHLACVFVGDATGGFQVAGCRQFWTTVNINQLASADFNADGLSDLALAGSSRARGEAIILLGNGRGDFHVGSSFEVPIVPVIEGLAAADFDGDLTVHLAIAGSGRTCIFLGDGTGGFGDPQCSEK